MADTLFGGTSNNTIGSGNPGADNLSFSTSGLADLVQSIAPAVIGGFQYFNQKDSIKDQQSALTGSYANAAGRLNEGYDQRQAISEQGADELIRLLTGGLKDTTNLYRNAAYDYGQSADKNVDEYAAYLDPILRQLTGGLSTSSDLYGAQLGQTEEQTAEELQQGSDLYGQKLAPYTEAGDEALGILRGIIGSDPNQLTDEQKYLIKDYIRDMQNNLAYSGLRGAGAAGVAAFNEGLGRTKAQLFQQNQARRDAATQALNAQGFNATNSVANNLNALKKSIADLRYKTGTTQAGNAFNVNSAIANAAYAQGKDVGSKKYDTSQRGTEAIYNTDKGIGQLTDKYYADVGNVTGDRYSNRGDTAMGKAQVDASTGLNTGRVNATTDALLTGLNTNALDKLGTILTQKNSAAAKGL